MFPSRHFLALACALALCLPLAACDRPPAPASAASNEIRIAAEAAADDRHRADAVLTARVREVLLKDPQLKAFEIRVVTTGGDAHLGGVLETQAQIDTALQLARDTPGIRAVHDEMTLNR